MHVKAEHSVLKALEYWFTYVKTVKVIIGHCVFRQFYILTGQINFNILVYAFSLKLQVYHAGISCNYVFTLNGIAYAIIQVQSL